MNKPHDELVADFTSQVFILRAGMGGRPVEPTYKMMKAIPVSVRQAAGTENVVRAYRAMVAAAPAPDDELHETLYKDVSLAIGLLLGQGYPGSAAAVAVLAEQMFPDIIAAYVPKPEIS